MTDPDGRHRFKTIKPAAHPAGPNRMRPAHIHFQVRARHDKIITQMYFADDPYNKTNPFLNSVFGSERQDLLVKKLQDPLPDFEPDSKTVVFDLVLYKG
jgi:protocatechuate 3,4-dioxygenase beta subunit